MVGLAVGLAVGPHVGKLVGVADGAAVGDIEGAAGAAPSPPSKITLHDLSTFFADAATV